MAARRTLRNRIRSGERAVGTFLLAFPSLAAARVAATSGADFVLIDGEHTGFGWETMTPVLTEIRRAGSVPFCRVPSATRENIGLALDVGAQGLMVPMVGTATEAEQVARWARYPPQGVRGAMFGLAPHDFTPVDPAKALRRANEQTIVMVQIETAEGLENVEEIAAVPGVDILWIGHYDLTISMGIPAQFDHPDYHAALDRIVAAGRDHGKAMGFLAESPEAAASLADRGFSVLAYGSDLALYRSALHAGIADVRGALQP